MTLTLPLAHHSAYFQYTASRCHGAAWAHLYRLKMLLCHRCQCSLHASWQRTSSPSTPSSGFVSPRAMTQQQVMPDSRTQYSGRAARMLAISLAK